MVAESADIRVDAILHFRFFESVGLANIHIRAKPWRSCNCDDPPQLDLVHVRSSLSHLMQELRQVEVAKLPQSSSISLLNQSFVPSHTIKVLGWLKSAPSHILGAPEAKLVPLRRVSMSKIDASLLHGGDETESSLSAGLTGKRRDRGKGRRKGAGGIRSGSNWKVGVFFCLCLASADLGAVNFCTLRKSKRTEWSFRPRPTERCRISQHSSYMWTQFARCFAC